MVAGEHRGSSPGPGDSLIVYLKILDPSVRKTQVASLTSNFEASKVQKSKPSNPATKQAIPLQNPDIAQPINQIKLSTHTEESESKETQKPANINPETASISTSIPSGGNTENNLLASYQAAIFKTWQRLSRHAYPIGCTIHISQTPGGNVTATSAAACGLSKEDQLQLEAAALMAQPMPYIGYEPVFSPEMDLNL